MSLDFDLNLIGCSVIDEVYSVPKLTTIAGSSNLFTSRYRAFGGIGNLWNVLKSSKLKIHVGTALGPKDSCYVLKNRGNLHASVVLIKETPSALILSEDGEKTSYVNWSNLGKIKEFPTKPAKWSHIVYLDLLPNLNLKSIRNNSEIISADLCLDTLDEKQLKKISAKFKQLDILFLSTNEVISYKELLGIKDIHLTKVAEAIKHEFEIKHAVILHGSGFVSVATKEGTFTVKTPAKVTNTPVVGAGDKLAAFIIRELILLPKFNLKTFEKIIRLAQRETAKTLETYEEI